MRGSAVATLVVVAVIVPACGAVGDEPDAPRQPPAVAAPTRTVPPPPSTTEGASVPPRVVAPDAAAAAAIPVEGATAAERATIAEVLALLGPDGPVTHVEVADDLAMGRTAQLRLRGERPQDVAAADWRLADLAGNEIVLRSAGGRHALRAYGTAVGAQPMGGAIAVRFPGPPRTAAELERVLDGIARRADEAGLRLARLDGYALGSGLVVARVRLTEAQFAHGPTDWTTLLAPASTTVGREYLVQVDAEAPDGTLFDPWSPEPSSAPPVADGPTRLTFAFRVLLESAGMERLQRLTLDCEPDGAVAALCERLETGRYELLPPIASDSTCSGVDGDWSSVEGVLLGEPIDRGYTQCEGVTGRLEALLDVRSLAPGPPAACVSAWNDGPDGGWRARAIERGSTYASITEVPAWPDAVGPRAACLYVLDGGEEPLRRAALLGEDGTGAGPVVLPGEVHVGEFTPSGRPQRAATVDDDGRLVPIPPAARSVLDCAGAWNLAGVGATLDVRQDRTLPAAVAVGDGATCEVVVDGHRLTGAWDDAGGLRWDAPTEARDGTPTPNADLAGGALQLRAPG